jgi:hypothetical protein
MDVNTLPTPARQAASRAIGQPTIPEPEQIERKAQEASALHEELCSQRGFAKAEAWLASDAPALIAALDKFDQPATKNDVATQVMMLLAAFPNASRPELKIYSKTLAEDIGAMQPGRLALEWACRKLRRTCKFVPAIAEVFEAVTKASTCIQNARWLATKRIPQMIEQEMKERERRRPYEERVAAERLEMARDPDRFRREYKERLRARRAARLVGGTEK